MNSIPMFNKLGLVLKDDGIWYSDNESHFSYPDEVLDNCNEVEDSFFWFRHRNKVIASAVDKFPPIENTIYDIGGGNGNVSLFLMKRGYEVVLIEPSLIGVKNAKENGEKNIICAIIEDINLQKNFLPAVGLFDVLEHIENDEGFLRKLYHLMKNGGRLYVTVPAYNSLYSGSDKFAGHFRRYSKYSLQKKMIDAGFKIDFSTYFFKFMPPIIFLLRTIPYKLGFTKKKRISKGRFIKQIKWFSEKVRFINFFIIGEISRIDKNKPMKFGGSCLIVARKWEN